MRKDNRYEWKRREIPRLSGQHVAFFAVDESEVVIEGIRHTIIGAVSFTEPSVTLEEMTALRSRLNLPDKTTRLS